MSPWLSPVMFQDLGMGPKSCKRSGFTVAAVTASAPDGPSDSTSTKLPPWRTPTPWLNPTDLLRYRIALHPRVPLPARSDSRPQRSCTSLVALARDSAAPLQRWFGLEGSSAALSVSVALVGSRETLAPVANLLGNATTARAVSHVWSLMRETSSWDIIQQAVIRLADYLHEHDSPIDYQRRRCLDYADLLPDTRWNHLCRTTDTPAGRPARPRRGPHSRTEEHRPA